MTKSEALAIVVREFVRELLREDEPQPAPTTPSEPFPVEQSEKDADGPDYPQPQFDFVEQVEAEVEAVRAGMEGEDPPDMDDLDVLAGEGGGPIARARRVAARSAERAQRAKERLWPEELPMAGMLPPEEIPGSQPVREFPPQP